MLLAWLAVVPVVSQSHMSISAAVQFLRTHPKGHGTAESNSEKTILTNDLPRSMPTSHEDQAGASLGGEMHMDQHTPLLKEVLVQQLQSEPVTSHCFKQTTTECTRLARLEAPALLRVDHQLPSSSWEAKVEHFVTTLNHLRVWLEESKGANDGAQADGTLTRDSTLTQGDSADGSASLPSQEHVTGSATANMLGAWANRMLGITRAYEESAAALLTLGRRNDTSLSSTPMAAAVDTLWRRVADHAATLHRSWHESWAWLANSTTS